MTMAKLLQEIKEEGPPPYAMAAIFTERDLRLIENCKVYAGADPAGLPGHNLMLIVSRLEALVGALMEGREAAELAGIFEKVAGDG